MEVGEGFRALYVDNDSSFGTDDSAIDNASALLDDPAGRPVYMTTHPKIDLRSGTVDGIFRQSSIDFPFPWEPTTFAARFTAYLVVPSEGLRTFGVNSDDGFRLSIDGKVVAEQGRPRAAATTWGSYYFPAAGRYPMVLDYYENFGGDTVEFFQEVDGEPRLINEGSEIIATLDYERLVEASAVTTIDAGHISAQIDLTDVPEGLWDVVLIPSVGSPCRLGEAVRVVRQPGDLDGDGDVDLHDFAIFQGCFGGPGVEVGQQCQLADLDSDGDVDLQDFALFVMNFTGPAVQ